MEFPLLQLVYITQDQHSPLHKSPDTSELPLLQSSCSKCRLKIQTCFWDYIIQEQRRGSAVQSVRAIEGKGWSSFQQSSLWLAMSCSINTVAFGNRNSKHQHLSQQCWKRIIPLLRKEAADYTWYKRKYLWLISVPNGKLTCKTSTISAHQRTPEIN